MNKLFQKKRLLRLPHCSWYSDLMETVSQYPDLLSSGHGETRAMKKPVISSIAYEKGRTKTRPVVGYQSWSTTFIICILTCQSLLYSCKKNKGQVDTGF